MSGEMIQFGKHKGKPVDALLDDRPYIEWLLTQSWFKEKYGNVYNVVINNGAEPSETPEHNAMQIRFLNKEYQQKLMHLLGETKQVADAQMYFEKDGADVLGDDYPAVLRQLQRLRASKTDICDHVRIVLLVGSYTGIGANVAEFREFFRSQRVKVVFADEVDAVRLEG